MYDEGNNIFLRGSMSRSLPTKMTCTISDALLAELDEACWQSRVNRSKFVCKALAVYLQTFHTQTPKNTPSNEEALTA